MSVTTELDLIERCFADPDDMKARADLAEHYRETGNPLAKMFERYYRIVSGVVKIQPADGENDLNSSSPEFNRLYAAAVCRLQPVGDGTLWDILEDASKKGVVLAEIGRPGKGFSLRILQESGNVFSRLAAQANDPCDSRTVVAAAAYDAAAAVVFGTTETAAAAMAAAAAGEALVAGQGFIPYPAGTPARRWQNGLFISLTEGEQK